MNTPAHLIFGLTLFGRSKAPRVNSAALAGAFAPDFSLYAMTAVSIWGLGIPAERVFRELYYSEAWQQVFAIDNSFVLWGLGLALALYFRSAIGLAFAAAGLLHLALDFPLHTHDARRHFWPITNWTYESPVSYWDNAAYAGVVGPVVASACVGLVVLAWRKFESLALRLFLLLLVAFELVSSGIWRLVF